MTRLKLETSPSLTPSTAARTLPPAITKCVLSTFAGVPEPDRLLRARACCRSSRAMSLASGSARYPPRSPNSSVLASIGSILPMPNTLAADQQKPATHSQPSAIDGRRLDPQLLGPASGMTHLGLDEPLEKLRPLRVVFPFRENLVHCRGVQLGLQIGPILLRARPVVGLRQIRLRAGPGCPDTGTGPFTPGPRVSTGWPSAGRRSPCPDRGPRFPAPPEGRARRKKAGCPMMTSNPSVPIVPSPMFSCRSTPALSSILLSLACTATNRDRPISLSSSSIAASIPSAWAMSYPAAKAC